MLNISICLFTAKYYLKSLICLFLAREGNGIKLQWSDCQEPCAGDGSFTSTGCGSSTHAVVQHTG